MMRCHPIVLLAGLLTVVRAQGQCVARHPSSSFILTSSFPIMAQLCLTLRSPALCPVYIPGYSLTLAVLAVHHAGVETVRGSPGISRGSRFLYTSTNNRGDAIPWCHAIARIDTCLSSRREKR